MYCTAEIRSSVERPGSNAARIACGPMWRTTCSSIPTSSRSRSLMCSSCGSGMNSVAAREVSVLGLDLVVGQVLEPTDLLDLQRQGEPVVEHQLDLVAEEHAPDLLQRDHAMAVVVPDRCVHHRTLDVASGDRPNQAHDACVPWSCGKAAARCSSRGR
jgi:hypothetical protein